MEGCRGHTGGDALCEAHKTFDQSNLINVGKGKIDRIVIIVFRNKLDSVLKLAWTNLFNKNALAGVYDVYFAPLKEHVGEVNELTYYHVAGLVEWCHAVAADGYCKIGFNTRNIYTLAFGFVDDDLAGKETRHSLSGDKRNAD